MSKKIAISIKSLDGLDAIIDPRFGRAYGFLIYDIEEKEVFAQFFNDAASAAHGAGTAAAVVLKTNDVEVVISGRFGPKAIESLNAFHIEMYTAPADLQARDVLARFEQRRLPKSEVKVF